MGDTFQAGVGPPRAGCEKGQCPPLPGGSRGTSAGPGWLPRYRMQHLPLQMRPRSPEGLPRASWTPAPCCGPLSSRKAGNIDWLLLQRSAGPG